ncbi:hypothetical protein [Paramagnetospirillum magneticum]|uniref:Uncharacterized protein n=1 Tax=Paramagnetospirillum magneticum (strain ATCC 700264 / AMB-1) TaxID=342108 RepID=Q2W356_PARM1|nr:hypothetical protein [Paramagnetospirillum magneticum]BAE51719.1 hypothetical protein amb2915 [Paramagnetospirillum magneticum AMB-1]
MLFQPAIIALLLASLAGTVMVAASVPFAVAVLRRWDTASGSEAQLEMEKRTYLVSTLLVVVLLSELASLVLFVFNADRMSSLFVGAMCAVGTLNVNEFGFPALYLKIVVFFAAGAWLVLNHVDSRGFDYPLVRVKYGALMALAPLMAAAAGVQLAYFLGLRADVIASCCSTLFSGATQVTSDKLAAVAPEVSLAGLALILGLAMAVGRRVLARGTGAVVYAVLSVLAFVVAMEAVVAAISVYVYELPHHHCPFCILKGEYGHVGYALYVPLFAAAVLGLGGGIAQWASGLPSLAEAAPRIMRRCVGSSMAGFGLFGAVTLWLIWRSHLILLEPERLLPILPGGQP